GAMVDAIAGGRPGVGMGIEMDQVNGAVFFGMSPQARVGDEMIPAQQQRGGTGLQNSGYVLLDVIDAEQSALAVAVVDHRQFGQRVYRPRPGSLPRQRQRSITDRSRAQPGTGTVGGGDVERHTADGDVDTCQVPGIRNAKEASCPSE